MRELREIINNQIRLNAGKNLLSENEKLLRLSQKSVQAIEAFTNKNKSSLDSIIDYTVDKVIRELCRVNQYYDFNAQNKSELRNIYTTLFKAIEQQVLQPEELAREHYLNLKKWLRKANPFSEKIYCTKSDFIEPVTCSEYSPELQLKILRIDITQIDTPVLDVGCGQEGNLVTYLREKGIEAYGIDRFIPDSPYIENIDWLEYDYGVRQWGAIISNLGFSNHFVHHHWREDGQYIDYARKYMQILNSLKAGGTFYYAPGLPFIEQHLDRSQYSHTEYQSKEQAANSVIIRRIR